MSLATITTNVQKIQILVVLMWLMAMIVHAIYTTREIVALSRNTEARDRNTEVIKENTEARERNTEILNRRSNLIDKGNEENAEL